MLSTANSSRGHRLGPCSDRTVRMSILIKMEDQMLLRDSRVVCRTEYSRFLRSSMGSIFCVRMEQLERRTDILKSLIYYMKQKRLSRFLRDLKIIQKVVALIKGLW